MNRATIAGLVGVAIVLGGAALWWRAGFAPDESSGQKNGSDVSAARPRPAEPGAPVARSEQSHAEEPVAAKAPPPDDRAERVKKILRDYQEIQAKMSADYGAAGAGFPGGLSAFLRQLALLEREKRADLAKAMTGRELEDYEIRETAAGQKMRTLLDGTAATDEQRRAAFRAEDAFNDQFGFTFDTSPAALAIREAGRQAAQREIRAALGDELFGLWVQRDDPGYAHLVEFARQQNLPAAAALALLDVRNGFTLNALDLATAAPETVEEKRAALLESGRAGVMAIAPQLPPDAVEREVRSWLGKNATAEPPRP